MKEQPHAPRIQGKICHVAKGDPDQGLLVAGEPVRCVAHLPGWRSESSLVIQHQQKTLRLLAGAAPSTACGWFRMPLQI